MHRRTEARCYRLWNNASRRLTSRCGSATSIHSRAWRSWLRPAVRCSRTLDPAGQKAWQEESKRRADLLQRKVDEYASRLVAAVSSKQAEARAVSLDTLVNLGTRGGPEPSWFRGVVSSLIGDFRSVPPMMQRTLLDYRWSTIKSPAMLPVLRDLVANPPAERLDPPIEALALRRLYELSPEEGRKIILDEIRRPVRNLPFSTLAMLPDATLPRVGQHAGRKLVRTSRLAVCNGRYRRAGRSGVSGAYGGAEPAALRWTPWSSTSSSTM